MIVPSTTGIGMTACKQDKFKDYTITTISISRHNAVPSKLMAAYRRMSFARTMCGLMLLAWVNFVQAVLPALIQAFLQPSRFLRNTLTLVS